MYFFPLYFVQIFYLIKVLFLFYLLVLSRSHLVDYVAIFFLLCGFFGFVVCDLLGTIIVVAAATVVLLTAIASLDFVMFSGLLIGNSAGTATWKPKCICIETLSIAI